MSRAATLGLLVATYVVVSVVAYTDFPRRTSVQPLTEIEHEGLLVWRRHNCQACHQIFGYGGFLGPDLTNRVGNETATDALRPMLTRGSGRMPALDLPISEQDAVLAYLRRLNRSGRSQPVPLGAGQTADPVDHFQQITTAWIREDGRDVAPAVRRGSEVWGLQRCGTCHLPFDVGPVLSPDLSGAAVDTSVARLHDLLDRGKGRMPSFRLTREETVDLSAYLAWVSTHRADLVMLNDRMLDREPFSWTEVPWFEYR
ncbi:MAG: cytochrome c [Vicinamibacterales bacterium]|nr:hypothetical protein [Acidobacteriota bacterium]MDP7293899.1 cytochrome c [Vicinamibacterales bacterium]MDP7471967.1 cytochrome c [Vicinamibacterales bacterium]MDP7671550.1 cytochrome c [Vicinamibacterales bacterium]HJO39481.1 cytochrome c [Vicinamibacterales bacterium]